MKIQYIFEISILADNGLLGTMIAEDVDPIDCGNVDAIVFDVDKVAIDPALLVAMCPDYAAQTYLLAHLREFGKTVMMKSDIEHVIVLHNGVTYNLYRTSCGEICLDIDED